MNPHLTPGQLMLFLAGEMPVGDSEAIEAHIDRCDGCRQLMSQTVRERHAQQAALASTVKTSIETLPVVVGDVIDGRYRIERLLGIGGMGCVFEAHQIHLNQRVALKFMLPQFSRDASAVDRFTREARAAVRLVTEHIGRVLDLGTLPSGEPYLVMEFLKGETVEQRLKREGPFAKALAVRVVREVSLALEEAHGLGIVHRDLKPANLFLAQRSNGTEVVKVLDFGIAKSVHPDIEAGLGSTSQKMILGSPLYMAPEQLSPGRPIDARTDVWAIGCVLHQLLTGQPPFDGADLVELMFAIQKKPHRDLAVKDSSFRDLSRIVDACLVKAPEGRLASVAQLRSKLDEIEVKTPAAGPVRRVRWAVATAAVALLIGGAIWAALPREVGPVLLETPSVSARPPIAVFAEEPVVPSAAPAAEKPVANRVEGLQIKPPGAKARPQPKPIKSPDLLDQRL